MTKKRRIRCLVCKQLVAPADEDFIPDEDAAYAVVPLRVANKVGCVCSTCVDKSYTTIFDNIEFAAGKIDPSKAPASTDENSSTNVEKALSPPKEEKPKEEKAKSEKTSTEKSDYEKLQEISNNYSCLDYSLDSLFSIVSRYVFGQDESIKTVLYSLYFNQFANYLEDIGQIHFKHKHILLIGGTGVGKTLLATTAAKAFGVTYSISNATPITSAGYIGDKVENILERLLDAANGNLNIAQNGVIIIDEFDKKRSKASQNGNDVTGEAVQQELLKLLEPSIVTIKKNTIPFYTGNLTIIMMGAFVGLDEIVEKRTKTHNLGFCLPDQNQLPTSSEILQDDLIQYGFIPEIIGRIPIVCKLNDLTHDVIVDIIYTTLERYNLLFTVKDFELYFDPVLIDKIADEVLEAKTGARDVENKIDAVLRPALYRIFQSRPGGICEIDSNGAIKILYKNLKNPTKIEAFETEPIQQYEKREADYN